MSELTPGCRANTINNGNSAVGKRTAAEKGTGKFRSMKRKRRGEKLDRDDMKVIAGTSGGSLVADGQVVVPKHGKEEGLGLGKVET